MRGMVEWGSGEVGEKRDEGEALRIEGLRGKALYSHFVGGSLRYCISLQN